MGKSNKLTAPSAVDKGLDRVADALTALDALDPTSPDYVKVVRNQMLAMTGLVRSVLYRTER